MKISRKKKVNKFSRLLQKRAIPNVMILKIKNKKMLRKFTEGTPKKKLKRYMLNGALIIVYQCIPQPGVENENTAA